MKLTRRLFGLATLAVLMTGLFAGAVRAGSQDFVLRNRMGLTINSVYVSPSTANTWGPDILKDKVLVNGADLLVTFPDDVHIVLWDLKVILSDGRAIVWTYLDLETISIIELYMRDGRPYAKTDAPHGGDSA